MALNPQEPHPARELLSAWRTEARIGNFVAYYNHLRYHESIANLTPADVYFGRSQTILLEREGTKRHTIESRRLIGDLFAGFCKDPKEGRLKGMTFKVEKSDKIGDVFVAQWVATAPFLAEPYKGSDAYITKDGYMQAMVSTFDGGALKMKK